MRRAACGAACLLVSAVACGGSRMGAPALTAAPAFTTTSELECPPGDQIGMAISDHGSSSETEPSPREALAAALADVAPHFAAAEFTEGAREGDAVPFGLLRDGRLISLHVVASQREGWIHSTGQGCASFGPQDEPVGDATNAPPRDFGD